MTRPDHASSDAAQLLARAAREPDVAAAFRSAYRGRHDALDALWWRAHPLTSSPRGVIDPATELSALTRGAFSREATGSPLIDVVDPETGKPIRIRESEHLLRAAQRQLFEDAQHLDAALERVADASVPAQVEHPSGDGTGADPAVDDADGVMSATVSRVPAGRRMLWSVAAGIVAAGAVVLGAIVIGPLSISLGSEPETRATLAPSRPVTPAQPAQPAQPAMPDLSILDRSQTPEDIPRVDLGASYNASSIRLGFDMDAFGPVLDADRGPVHDFSLYVARMVGDDRVVCLIVLFDDDTAAGSCLPVEEFTTSGIRFTASHWRTIDGGEPELIYGEFNWRPDGGFGWSN